MSTPIKVGLVGFGISSRVFHAPFVSTMPGYELVAVVERNKTESKEAYPNIKLYRNFDELIEDPMVELVVITTPNDTHHPYSLKALAAGKHVVVEKPFANSLQEAEEMVEAARKSDKVLSVYQNRRYVADYLTIKEILDKDLLGDVHEFITHYDRYRPEPRANAWREEPKPGSGILYDLGSHLIDQSLSLFGKPSFITADIRLQRPHARIDDFFDILLDYGKLRVRLHSGMLVREMGPRYMMHGNKGSYIKFGEDPQEALLRLGHKPVGEDWGKEEEQFYGILHTEINGEVVRKAYPSKRGHFGFYYENLYETIRNGMPLRERPEHGYNTIRVIELVLQSSKEKRTVECSGLLDV